MTRTIDILCDVVISVAVRFECRYWRCHTFWEEVKDELCFFDMNMANENVGL